MSPAPRAVVLDVEGTTGSLSFVRDVLFPFARRALPALVEARGNEPGVRAWLDRVTADAPTANTDEARLQVLGAWMDEDRKHPALKALQGLTWEAGYASGAFSSHLYPDVAPALSAWKAQGHALFVYSSGSVRAQELYFGHTAAGDLRPLLSGHFDTAVGGKREAASYARIAREVGRAPVELLFLSDVVEELDAARAAGLGTVLVDRPQDYPTPRTGEAARGHARVTSFAGLRP
ncbi:MAG: acireductone synthase [Pseudomonadota bacterium]|jgi:enolase-phosphatase E1